MSNAYFTEPRCVYIWLADEHIRRARQFWTGPDGLLAPGYWDDLRRLLDAANDDYRKNGLGLLAGRAAFFARRVAAYRELTDARDLWSKFDRLNAATRRQFEEGRV